MVEVNNVLFAFHNLLVYICSKRSKKNSTDCGRIRIIDLKENVEKKKIDTNDIYRIMKKTNDFFSILYFE
jgi:hypothetical protein